MTEMQVEESMMHFPSQYNALDSPSSTVYSPAISDCDASMSVDPAVNPPTPLRISGCYGATADTVDGGMITDFHTTDRHQYDGQLYGIQQQPTGTYPDFDLDELENIFGSVAEVERQIVNNAVAATNGHGSPRLESLHETEEHMRQSAAVQHAAAQQQRTDLERSNSLSHVSLNQPPRLQHNLSMRILSSSSSSRPVRNGRHVLTNGSARNQTRSSKPVFPTESVPLQQVSRRERPPSATPSIVSTRSDLFDTHSIRSAGALSDPGYAYSVRSRDSGTGSVWSAPGGLQRNVSPGDILEGFSDSENDTKACMEVEMNMKDVKKIVELDKKILKLQAERSKLVEKASQITAKVTDSQNDQYGSSTISKPQDLVRVHLFFVPVGIHILDEPVFEEANSLLRRIGGKYFDLERAIATLRNICCKGMVVVPDFSTCFAYIKSLLQETQRLQLSDNAGIYQIELDSGANGGSQSVPQEFTDALFMANRVLHAAQAITHSYHAIQIQLQKVQGMARDRSEACDALCQQIGLLERDRRSQIKSVMDGNFATLSTAVRVWPQYYRAATETIRSITQCIHPSNI